MYILVLSSILYIRRFSMAEDYELTPVPKEARRSFWSITIVWTGYVFVVTSMIAGGGLAQSFQLKDVFLITFIGNLFLSFIAVGMSFIAVKTGLTFALITRYSFGNQGSRIVSFFGPVVNIGWYVVQSAIYGSMISQMLGLEGWYEILAMALSALVMGLIALIGFNALNTLGLVAIPAIIFLCIATAIRSLYGVEGGMGTLFARIPATEGFLSEGLMIVIGTWIFSASTCVADIMRYAKNMKQAILSAVLSLVVGNSLLITCGAIASSAAGQSDLPLLLISIGLVLPGFILLTTNIFTTNGTNLYSNALALSNVFRGFNRKHIFYGMIAFSMILTIFRPNRLDIFFTFLNTLSKVIPALPGIIFVDFYFFNKTNYPSLDSIESVNIKWPAFVAWISATVLTFIIPIGFAPVNGIVLGAVIYFILNINKILKK